MQTVKDKVINLFEQALYLEDENKTSEARNVEQSIAVISKRSKLTAHDVLACKAYALFNSERYKEALNVLSELTTAQPAAYEYWSLRGSCFQNLQDYANAILDFNNALKIEEDDFQTVLHRGECLLTLGQYGRALKDYTRLQELAKHGVECFDAAYGRFVCLYNTDRLAEAIPELTVLIEFDQYNHFPDFYQWRSQAYQLTGDAHAAKKDKQKYLDLLKG